MQSRYKLIIANKNLYKEVELHSEAKAVKIGTAVECDVRLRKELFFESIELSLTENNGVWSITCSENLFLDAGDVRKLLTKELKHGDIFFIKYGESNNEVFTIEFLIDFDNGQRKYERAINITDCKAVTIGVAGSSNIVLNSPYIKNDSIILKRNDTGFSINIQNASYGVYHNGNKAKNGEQICNGDFISISDFIFYYKNNVLWTEIRDGMQISSLSFNDYPNPNSYPKFTRNTRIKTILNSDKIEILDPPNKQQKAKGNLITKFLPSLGMLATSMVMAFMGGVMVIISVISGVMAIVTAIIGVIQGDKDFKKNSAERIEKYNKYISKKCAEIEACRAQEKSELENIFISPEHESNMFSLFSSDLFDRSKDDDDFMQVRLGIGDVVAKREVKYKNQERLEIEDDLQTLPEKLSKDYRYIKMTPIVCDFKTINAIGIIGHEEHRFSMMKNIVLDLCARQYYSDVKFIFIATEDHKERVNWLRLLPHVQNDMTDSRNIVCNDESKTAVFEYLFKELTFRGQNKKHNDNIIVFLYDEYGFKNHPISRFVDAAKSLGITFVFFADQKADIPLGCEYLVDINGPQNAKLINTLNKDDAVDFSYTTINDYDASRIVNMLSPVYTEEISLEGSLTKNITLYELLNILSVDDLDLTKRWESSQVSKSMAAPLGVSKTGVVYLNLHDKAHGPHGLVAGTTGSGKSEILQTYILSIATLFHPYEIAFLIIDFKGGGMVNQFKDLPHLLGAITNIDGKEIDRSLKSIKAELQKRQRLFAEAEVNHIDKYISKYKSGGTSIPLPHLVVIVDEFAELKAEQPEFMKELISAARIGRSLGVHLILATQKPAGQVNEQIWSNSRFKLCLKVASIEDSNDMIKSPLAAEIKEPGRAYFQVGNNEIFELFQSAYSGASDKADDASVKEFTLFSFTPGGRRQPVFVQKKQKAEGLNLTQLDAVVSYVSSYSTSANIKKLPNICLPSLEDYITVPSDFGKYDLSSLPLGIYDDPDSQYQGYGKFDLCSENTLIIGSSLTGKTNLLQTIIRLVSEHFSPKEATFYIIDFGAMYLTNFEPLNHVGGVVTIAEDEKLKNLFKLLMEEIQNRKARFKDMGLSSYSAYTDAGYTDLPHVFLMVDNFTLFKEVYSDTYEDEFVYIAREGLSCGISVIVANSQTNGLGYKYMANFANRYALTCNDTSEYISLFDRCRMQPKDVPGRMLCKLNKEIFEMQSFIAFEGKKEIERSNTIKVFIEKINKQYFGECAKQIPSIPEVLSFGFIDANYPVTIQNAQYPIALDYSTIDMVTIDFKAINELCIIGKDSKKKLSAVDSILSSINHNILSASVKLYIIDSVERPLKAKSQLSYIEKYTIDYTEIATVLDEVIPELEARYAKLMENGVESLEKDPLILVVVNNKDVTEYISTTKEVLEIYNRILKQYKALGIAFIYSNIDDAPVGYNSGELMKRFKDNKNAVVVSNLKDFKFCELPSNVVRASKALITGDAYLLNGSEVSRIKMIEEG